MSDVSVTATPKQEPRAATAVRLGHPVRGFVLMLVIVGLALIGLQASGAVNPRVRVSESGSGGGTGGREARWVLLQNDGFSSARVEAISWSSTGWSDVRLGLPPIGADPHSSDPEDAFVPFEPFTLGAGHDEARWLVLAGRPCAEHLEAGPIEVRVRSALGAVRTVELGNGMTTVVVAADCP